MLWPLSLLPPVRRRPFRSGQGIDCVSPLRPIGRLVRLAGIRVKRGRKRGRESLAMWAGKTGREKGTRVFSEVRASCQCNSVGRGASIANRSSRPIRFSGIDGDSVERHGLERRCIEVGLDRSNRPRAQIADRPDGLLDHGAIRDIESSHPDCHIHGHRIGVFYRRPCICTPVIIRASRDPRCYFDTQSGSGRPPEASDLDESASKRDCYEHTDNYDDNDVGP
jgi:hypothetical protein